MKLLKIHLTQLKKKLNCVLQILSTKYPVTKQPVLTLKTGCLKLKILLFQLPELHIQSTQ